ncbi:MAG: LemA family protein [Synergistaceae bacterium]|jgi:LemA protein|nr:LemA family protein [Synergistaceae bacterium]
MENGTTAAVVIGVIVVGVILWYVSTRNRFARLAVKITESDSGIEVALTKRYDTLIKMLDVTKGYAKHEAEVLGNIVKLRQGMSMAERSAANARMDELAGRLNVLVENYPELKAGENYKQLQMSVSDVEEHLQAARRIYNMNVSAFNQLLASWPASIVGSQMGQRQKEFFEAEEHKKQDVKMNF